MWPACVLTFVVWAKPPPTNTERLWHRLREIKLQVQNTYPQVYAAVACNTLQREGGGRRVTNEDPYLLSITPPLAGSISR